MTEKEQLLAYAQQTYQTEPDYPFRRFPTCAAIRHADNRKIYGLFMDVQRKKLGLSDHPDEYVDIVNVKVDPDMRMMLAGQRGILPSYHMHAGSWISILLDGTVSIEQICSLLDMSYMLTSSSAKNGKPHNPYWIVPANPKYYDVDQAVKDGNGEFIWKQAKGAAVGDIVYLYVAAPVSAIRYACKVLETNLPYHYKDEKLTVMKVMNLKVLYTFDPDLFSINTLRTYGVTTVRGPRSVPAELLQELKRYTQ